MAFHVTTSLTNPFYGVSMEALAQGSDSGGGGTGDGSCPMKPAGFDCDHGGSGAISCEISETLFGIYSKGCKVTCEGNGCYACCDDEKDKCICVTFNI